MSQNPTNPEEAISNIKELISQANTTDNNKDLTINTIKAINTALSLGVREIDGKPLVEWATLNANKMPEVAPATLSQYTKRNIQIENMSANEWVMKKDLRFKGKVAVNSVEVSVENLLLAAKYPSQKEGIESILKFCIEADSKIKAAVGKDNEPRISALELVTKHKEEFGLEMVERLSEVANSLKPSHAALDKLANNTPTLATSQPTLAVQKFTAQERYNTWEGLVQEAKVIPYEAKFEKAIELLPAILEDYDKSKPDMKRNLTAQWNEKIGRETNTPSKTSKLDELLRESPTTVARIISEQKSSKRLPNLSLKQLAENCSLDTLHKIAKVGEELDKRERRPRLQKLFDGIDRFVTAIKNLRGTKLDTKLSHAINELQNLPVAKAKAAEQSTNKFKVIGKFTEALQERKGKDLANDKKPILKQH